MHRYTATSEPSLARDPAGWRDSVMRCLASLLLSLFCWSGLSAEPYIAVREGLKCAACHTNPTGGGKRTVFGNTYGQTGLPARRITSGESDPYWTGEFGRWIGVGGDFRGGWDYTDVPNREETSEFEVEEGLVYVDVNVVPGTLSFYLDQQVAPGASTNREAYARFTAAEGRVYVKAGQLFLPYGLRLEDDGAFVRQVTGINFATPDRGAELGLELDRWSAQLALTNGTAGGPETDRGKQASLLATYVASRWRLGASFNFNDAEAGERQMQGAFAGLRTGPVVWLGEIDYIRDEGFATGRRNLWAGLVEANWLLRKGHNLKLTYEWFDPDDDLDEDERTRSSLVWEYVPFQFTQVRAGVRVFDGIPQNDLQNRDEAFAELHIYF